MTLDKNNPATTRVHAEADFDKKKGKLDVVGEKPEIVLGIVFLVFVGLAVILFMGNTGRTSDIAAIQLIGLISFLIVVDKALSSLLNKKVTK